jgi:choline-sulfatase
MVYLHSLFPTTCDLAGVKIPKTVQSKSLAPLLSGKKKKINDAIFGSYKSFQRMVRTEDYKLIIYPKAKQIQLFDIKNDPWETKNLADDPKHAGTIKKLKAKLKKLQKEVGDTLDIDNMPAAKKKS